MKTFSIRNHGGVELARIQSPNLHDEAVQNLADECCESIRQEAQNRTREPVEFSREDVVIVEVDDIRNTTFPSFEELVEAGYVRDEVNGLPAEEFRKDIGRGEFSCPAGWSRLVTGEFGYRDSYGGFWTPKKG